MAKKKKADWKIIKKNSTATYSGRRVRIEEILLDRALIRPINGKERKVVAVSSLKKISPKPK